MTFYYMVPFTISSTFRPVLTKRNSSNNRNNRYDRNNRNTSSDRQRQNGNNRRNFRSITYKLRSGLLLRFAILKFATGSSEWDDITGDFTNARVFVHNNKLTQFQESVFGPILQQMALGTEGYIQSNFGSMLFIVLWSRLLFRFNIIAWKLNVFFSFLFK